MSATLIPSRSRARQCWWGGRWRWCPCSRSECSASQAPGEAAPEAELLNSPLLLLTERKKHPPGMKAKRTGLAGTCTMHPLHLHPSPRNKEGPDALQTPRACSITLLRPTKPPQTTLSSGLSAQQVPHRPWCCLEPWFLLVYMGPPCSRHLPHSSTKQAPFASEAPCEASWWLEVPSSRG